MAPKCQPFRYIKVLRSYLAVLHLGFPHSNYNYSPLSHQRRFLSILILTYSEHGKVHWSSFFLTAEQKCFWRKKAKSRHVIGWIEFSLTRRPRRAINMLSAFIRMATNDNKWQQIPTNDNKWQQNGNNLAYNFTAPLCCSAWRKAQPGLQCSCNIMMYW